MEIFLDFHKVRWVDDKMTSGEIPITLKEIEEVMIPTDAVK